MMNNLIGKIVEVKRPTFKVELVINEIKNITDEILSVSGRGRNKNWTFTMTKEELINGLI